MFIQYNGSEHLKIRVATPAVNGGEVYIHKSFTSHHVLFFSLKIMSPKFHGNYTLGAVISSSVNITVKLRQIELLC
jgi:hypothetical protein